MRTGGPAPSIGFSYGGRDPALLDRIGPHVDVLEVTPDDLVNVDGNRVRLDDRVVDHLREISRDFTIVVHGVGLTIGSHEGCSETYLGVLSDLLDRVEVAWHSEHLGYTTVDGSYLGAMLTLPRTDEVLTTMTQRAAAVQRRFGIPFLLENVAGLLPDPGGEHTPAGFLNALASEAGCGLLLDLYNLECDAANQGLDVHGFLDELDLSLVGELHVAGGVQRLGLQLDVHSRLTNSSTRQLAARAAAGLGRADVTTLFELLPQAVQIVGHQAIANELQSLGASMVEA